MRCSALTSWPSEVAKPLLKVHKKPPYPLPRRSPDHALGKHSGSGRSCVFPRSFQKIPKILARNGCRNVQETLARYDSEVTSLAGAESMLKA